MAARREDFQLARGEFNSSTSGVSCTIHKFGSTEDNLGGIQGADYFNVILAAEIAQLTVLKGDMLIVVDRDGDAQQYKFTAVTPNVVIATL